MVISVISKHSKINKILFGRQILKPKQERLKLKEAISKRNKHKHYFKHNQRVREKNPWLQNKTFNVTACFCFTQHKYLGIRNMWNWNYQEAEMPKQPLQSEKYINVSSL